MSDGTLVNFMRYPDISNMTELIMDWK